MKVIAWLIVIGCMVILQTNSIPMWQNLTDAFSGAILSVMLEIVALWFWYQGNKILAPLASMAVIASALFHLSSSSIESLKSIEVDNQSKKQKEVIISVLDNIKDKQYPMTIQRTLASLDKISSDKSVANKTTASVWLNILLQALALSLILIGQIKAILFIARNHENKVIVTPMKVKKTVTETPSNIAVDSSMVDLAKDVLRALRAYGLENNLNSETLIRKSLNLSAPTFSRLRDTAVSGVGMSEKNMILIKERIQKEMK